MNQTSGFSTTKGFTRIATQSYSQSEHHSSLRLCWQSSNSSHTHTHNRATHNNTTHNTIQYNQRPTRTTTTTTTTQSTPTNTTQQQQPQKKTTTQTIMTKKRRGDVSQLRDTHQDPISKPEPQSTHTPNPTPQTPPKTQHKTQNGSKHNTAQHNTKHTTQHHTTHHTTTTQPIHSPKPERVVVLCVVLLRRDKGCVEVVCCVVWGAPHSNPNPIHSEPTHNTTQYNTTQHTTPNHTTHHQRVVCGVVEVDVGVRVCPSHRPSQRGWTPMMCVNGLSARWGGDNRTPKHNTTRQPRRQYNPQHSESLSHPPNKTTTQQQTQPTPPKHDTAKKHTTHPHNPQHSPFGEKSANRLPDGSVVSFVFRFVR